MKPGLRIGPRHALCPHRAERGGNENLRRRSRCASSSFRFTARSTVSSPAQTWLAALDIDEFWGHFRFPPNSLKLQCQSNNAEVLLQESVNPDSTVELSFDRGDVIAVVGNTFLYFGDKVKKHSRKNSK
jgi:hypothetical protein